MESNVILQVDFDIIGNQFQSKTKPKCEHLPRSGKQLKGVGVFDDVVGTH